MGSDVKTAPRRRPARPKPLERVCMIATLGYWVAHSAQLEPGAEKSIYASSKTTTPFHVGCSRTFFKSSFANKPPVGFPGVHRYTSLMFGSSESAFVMPGTSREKFGDRRGTFTRDMSLIWALTLYMPYVGGQTRILSMEGRQKARRRASMVSSEPTPKQRLRGVRGEVELGVLRRLQRSCLRGCW